MGTQLSDLLATLARLNGASKRRSLGEVAALVHLSPSRAQRVFARLVGESPGRYQHRVALNRAAAQLAATNRPIVDIAFDNGFGSHEGFSRAFRAHYGISPREYRTLPLSRWSDDERDLAEHSAACIGLYGKPLTDQPTKAPEETFMEDATTHPIAVRELAPTPVLYMARRIDKDRVADVLAELLPAVFQYVMEQGLPMAGPPYVRYMEQSAAFLAVQAGIPLTEPPKPPEPERNIEVGELPGGPAVTVIHQGPYESLADGYMALDRWMADNDRSPAGPPWEVYLTDPGEVPDPKDWQTEILWPIS